MEAGYIVFLLPPYHRNFGKRLVKTPKLYFLDTGQAAHLLGIRDAPTLATHAQRGALFETLVVAEYVKRAFHAGQAADLYFWRDSAGHEVDLLLEQGGKLQAVEIKSGVTLALNWFLGLRRWQTFVGEESFPPLLIYGGDAAYQREGGEVVGWKSLSAS